MAESARLPTELFGLASRSPRTLADLRQLSVRLPNSPVNFDDRESFVRRTTFNGILYRHQWRKTKFVVNSDLHKSHRSERSPSTYRR